MSAQLDWGAAELVTRRAEDARFPVEPAKDSPDWGRYAQMKWERHRRRKRAGYSRATANELVAWAEREEAAR